MIHSESKPSIQLKLETWKKPVLSKNSLQSKLTAASQRKEHLILKVVQRVTTHRMDVRNKQKTKDLAIYNKAKLNAVVQRKNESLLDISLNVANIRNMNHQRALLSRGVANALKVSSAQKKIEDKMILVCKRQKEIIAAKTSKSIRKASIIGTQNKGGANSKGKLTEESLLERQGLVTRNKQIIVNNNLAKIQSRILRISAVREERILMVNNLQEKLSQKQTHAYLKREEVMKNITQKSNARENRSREIPINIQQIKDHSIGKMISASQRKTEFLSDITSYNKIKANKVEAYQQEKYQKTKALALRLKRKLHVATQRKSKLLSDISTNLANIYDQRHQRVLLYRDSKILNLATILKKKKKLAFDRRNEIITAKSFKVTKNVITSLERRKKITIQRNSYQTKMKLENEKKIETATERRKLFLFEKKTGSNKRVSNIRRDKLQQMKIQEDFTDRLLAAQTQAEINVLSAKKALNEAKSLDEDAMTVTTMPSSDGKEESVCTDTHSEEGFLSYADSVLTDEFSDITLTSDILTITSCKKIKLSDIEILQSIALAEEASVSGKSEFKTVDRLEDLDSVKMTMSVPSTDNKIRVLRSQLVLRFVKVKKQVGKKVSAIRLPRNRKNFHKESVNPNYPIILV